MLSKEQIIRTLSQVKWQMHRNKSKQGQWLKAKKVEIINDKKRILWISSYRYHTSTVKDCAYKIKR